jgi:hypothetical protein
MATHKAPDGIGPEIMEEVRPTTDLVGGSAYDAHGQAISDATWTRRWPPTPCCSAPSAVRSGTRCL